MGAALVGAASAATQQTAADATSIGRPTSLTTRKGSCSELITDTYTSHVKIMIDDIRVTLDIESQQHAVP